MNTLELFAGSRSFSKVAEKFGHETFTTDIEPFEKIDVVCDIFDFDVSPNGKLIALEIDGEIFVKQNDKDRKKANNISKHFLN